MKKNTKHQGSSTYTCVYHTPMTITPSMTGKTIGVVIITILKNKNVFIITRGQ